MADTRISREEAESALEARRELGPEMEPAVVDAFADRIEGAIQARVAAEAERRWDTSDRDMGFVLAIVSLGTGIPITAIAAGEAGVQGMVVAWLGIVGVNVAHRLRR